MKRAFPAALALLIALLSLTITAWLWRHERESGRASLAASFDFELRQTASRIEQRMASYEQMLRGAQGLFMASEAVGRAGFEAYVDSLLAGPDFAGLQSVVYAPLLSAERVSSHVTAQRAGGFAAYAIRPVGERPFYAPVTYVAPAGANNDQILGLDLLSEPIRRAALDQARDSGGIAITGQIRLLTDAATAP